MHNIRLEPAADRYRNRIRATVSSPCRKNGKCSGRRKVQRSLPEGISAEEFYPQRAGIMAEFAKVICISIGYFKKEGNLFSAGKILFRDDEKTPPGFFSHASATGGNEYKWNFTGHNIKEFDMPFLCRRIIINGLVIPAVMDFQNMKPWETNMVDTFQYWRFGDYKQFTSLKLLAAALKVPSSKR